MKKILKSISIIVIIFIVSITGSLNISAISKPTYLEQDKENTIDSIESSIIPQNKKNCILEMHNNIITNDVYEYALDRLLPLASTVNNSAENFGNIINNLNHISFGTPYIIYNAFSGGNQSCIYYFPVVEDNDVKCILSICKEGDYLFASLSEDIAEELNDINYLHDNDYIFYCDGKYIYAENNEKIKRLDVTIDDEYNVDSQDKQVSFKKLLLSQKVQHIKDTYGIKRDIQKNAVSLYDNAKGFSSKTSTNVRLNTNGCLVQQYSDGNCWAASVATTLRYLNYSKFKNVTARNVCDKIHVGYNAGGNLVTRQKALIAYGISYYNDFLSYPMEFGLIQKNILNQRPILASCVGTKSGSGHAVTGIGYTTYGGIKQVVFYNSGNNKCVTTEYKTKGLTFSYNNESYRWRSSLSCY